MSLERVQQIQEMAAKTPVAGGCGIGAFSFACVADIVNLFHQIGLICGGILSACVLANWLYIKLIKKKVDKW